MLTVASIVVGVTPPQSPENVYFIHAQVTGSYHTTTSWNAWQGVSLSSNLNASLEDCHFDFPRAHNGNPPRVHWGPDSKAHEHLKCGHCSRGDPIFWFFYFWPLHAFFGIFLQNWNLRPWFILGAPIPDSHSMGRGSLIFEGGPHHNHTIWARFFHSGLSRI
jgi:hypothetical protein